MIIDHIGFGVSDYGRAKAFYARELAPLEIALVMEVTPEQTGKVWACGFGKGSKPEFWIGSDGKTAPPTHIAFLAESRAEVRAFYEAALKAGGKTTARLGSARGTTRTTTAPSSSISTGTTSRRSAISRSEAAIRASALRARTGSAPASRPAAASPDRYRRGRNALARRQAPPRP
jgi:hypothetical protein